MWRINTMCDEEDMIDIEWWSEDSLEISLEVSRELYLNMVSKVQC